MTRVWNRRGIMELITREWSECQRRGAAVAICVADIDRFKAINDTFGHPAGDRVIQAVAKILLAGLRGEDAVGRIGGEEFLILLPGCRPDQLKSTMERLRAGVELTPIEIEGSKLNVTMSFGVSLTRPRTAGPSAADLIKAADTALYAAKRGGRNRVVRPDLQ